MLRRNRLLESLSASMTLFLQDQNWKAAADLLVRSAIDLTDSELGLLYAVEEGKRLQLLTALAAAEVPPGEVQTRELGERLGKSGLLGTMLSSLEPVVSDSVGSDPRCACGSEHRSAVDSFLGVPVLRDGVPVAVIGVADRIEPYDSEQLADVSVLAQIAGILHDSHMRAVRANELEVQLVKSQRLEAVGTLAAGISHEFNNILTGILGYAEFLGSEPLSEQAEHDLGQIVVLGNRAAVLVKQILDFSRRTVIVRKPIDLPAVIAGGLDQIFAQLSAGVELVPVLAPEPIVVDGDRGQLLRVVANLVQNACEALPEGGRIELGLRRLDVSAGTAPPMKRMPAGGSWAFLWLTDDGAGMSSEVQRHLFEPFFTTKSIGKGPGLGLAQAYGIVKQHGGFIDVESSPSAGTRVAIYLPLASGRQESEHPKAPELAGEEVRRSILVAEDEEMVREVASRMLQVLGFEVTAVENGREALELIERDSSRFAAVLTDVVMPVMGGEELALNVRQSWAGIPVVMMSGYPLELDAVCDSARAWVMKPLRLEDLSRALQKCDLPVKPRR